LIVEIQELTYTYNGSDTPALEQIDLQVHKGQFLTITGPSGCGKSTLALCLAGFIPHAYGGKMEGTVHIQGKNTKDYAAGGLSGIVGLVQQDPEAQLCTLTVSDEVAFGPENLRMPPEEIRERVSFALETVGAADLRNRMLHTLSGGEKQRVAIASVLAMTPALLILDEPTANLDPSCTSAVLKTLKKLRDEHNISIIVIEHRLEKLVAFSDRLLFMQNGRLVAENTSRIFCKDITPSFCCADLKAAWQPQKKPTDNFEKKEGKPLLSVKNLKAGYEGKEVLAGISFCAYAGEIIAVMGDNGSGKTTLLMTLLGIIKGGGELFLGGDNITGVKVARRARDMGLTFQNPNHQIFENTVFKEAALPSLFLSKEPLQEIEYKVGSLLEKFELQQYRERNPFTLSLGEKKRLTLVSVLAYTPRLLVLDEPLVGQDSGRLRFFNAALQEHQARGGVTLMVCHEPNVVASCCQRILFLEGGKLTIDAPVNEALRELAGRGLEEYLPSGVEIHSWEERK
jgi:energy-coupling factor transporter ATP-binding protein EcfA2